MSVLAVFFWGGEEKKSASQNRKIYLMKEEGPELF